MTISPQRLRQARYEALLVGTVPGFFIGALFVVIIFYAYGII